MRPLLLRGLRNIQALGETRLLRPFRRVTHRVLDSQRSCSSSVEENPMIVDLFTEGLDYTLFEAERVDFDEIIGLSPYKIACA